MKRYTVSDILAWHPCARYTEATLRALFGKRRAVTLLDILFADIKDEDAVWAVCRAMNDRQRRHFACDCAESVLHIANDPRSAEAVRVARLYADGLATDGELADAYSAVRSAYAASAAATYAAASAASAAYAATAAAYAAAAADAAYAATAAAAAASAAATYAAASAASAAYAATAAADAAATTVAATDAAVAASVAAAASAAASAACAASDAADARGDQRQALIMLVLSGEIK